MDVPVLIRVLLVAEVQEPLRPVLNPSHSFPTRLLLDFLWALGQHFKYKFQLSPALQGGSVALECMSS